jgi:hypothetical protein
MFLFLFPFFPKFSTQFPNTISKALSLCSIKVLSQEDSKFADHVLQGVKKALFFTSNAIILQSMWPNFLKHFQHLILIVQRMILWLNLQKRRIKKFKQFALKVAIFGLFLSQP